MSNISYNQNIMENIENKIYSRLKLLIEKKSLHYIDIPLHNNVGDLLIYEGTEIVLKALQCKVLSRITLKNKNLFLNKTLKKDEIILLHGGGNFGDIWPGHHQFRLDIIRKFSNNPIIILPQSIHFDNKDKLNETINIFKSHNNLLLFVRDKESYDLMKPFLLDNVEMLPDMAHTIHSKISKYKGLTGNQLILRRNDKEKISDNNFTNQTFDWDNMFGLKDKIIRNIIRQYCALENYLKIDMKSMYLWHKYTDNIILRAQKVFKNYELIDTDRLHGAIFSLLLGKNIILRDNYYGKLSRYFSAWYHPSVI